MTNFAAYTMPLTAIGTASAMMPIGGGPVGDDTGVSDAGNSVSFDSGPTRRELFDSLFTDAGPPHIRSPRFVPTVERLAASTSGMPVKVLFAEGPGDVLPSVRFLTRLPGVSVERVLGMVNETHSWAEWVPMLAAIEVHEAHDTEHGSLIQKVVMKIEGFAAKLIGMGTLASTHRKTEDRYEGIAQSRWSLVRPDEGDLAANRGSWTLVPLRDNGIAAVYEGHQVPRLVERQNFMVRKATVAVIRSQAPEHLRTTVDHLAHRSADPDWNKRSRVRSVSFAVEKI